MSTNELYFSVNFEKYAERHYIKSFAKKYKKAWGITQIAITEELKRAEALFGLTNRLELIMTNCEKSIAKLDFRIAGSRESTKSSGNRAIVYFDREMAECRVLLVYFKNEISSPNETQKWKEIIKNNYPEIWDLF